MSETGSLGANLGLNVNRSELEINIGEKRKNEEVKVVETKTEESAFGGRAASQTFQEIQYIDDETTPGQTRQETPDYDIPKPHKIAIQLIAEECYDLPRSSRDLDHHAGLKVKNQAEDIGQRFVNSPKSSGSGTDWDQLQSGSIEPSIYDSPRSSADSPRLIISGQNSEQSFYDSPKASFGNVHADSPRSPPGVKTIKKFPLLSKNYVINEEKPEKEMKMGVKGLESSSQVFQFPTNSKKNTAMSQSPTFMTTTSININEHYQTPPLRTIPVLKTTTTPTVTTTTTPVKEKLVKTARTKENTPLGFYENSKSKTVPSSKLDIEYHYGVRNVKSGELDVYAKPVPSATVTKTSGTGNTLSVPPDLPPRNTPQSSPRSSVVLSHDEPDVSSELKKTGEEGIMNMDSMSCARCDDGFEPKAKIVNSNGELYHPECFVCAQCFRPFPDGVFYEFEGRKYCEHDFHVLFAPCCGKCGEFIIGRVIKAMMATWHPQCFCCEMCHKELADLGFIKNQGRALCHDCNAKVKAEGIGKYMCQKCHSVIDGEPLRFRGEVYHPYHYNCAACGSELTSTAREVRTRPGYTANELNELYCLRCHDKMGIPICGACRRPIEERVVTALGKHWHVEHFVCAKCEKPFLGNRHYERKGLAYCETHYHQLFGNLCYVCNQVIQGDVFTALNKAWCVNHFACSSCDQKMTVKTKFYEVDLKPVCKKCYDRYPRELRLRLKKYHENEAARDQGTPLVTAK